MSLAVIQCEGELIIKYVFQIQLRAEVKLPYDPVKDSIS